MHFVSRGDVRLHWRADGDRQCPALVLLNSIGTDMSLWDPVIPFLVGDHYLLRLDTRGHGRSGSGTGDYDLAMLAADVAAVMDAAGVDRAAIAGVSLGGMIAMELALRHPDRVAALIPICTSATMDRAAWSARVETVRSSGTAAIADLAMSRFLSPQFIDAHPRLAARIRQDLIAMSDGGYAGAAAAIRDMDLRRRLSRIAARTLLVVGDRDSSTPYEGHGEHLARAIPDNRLVHLASAHLAPVEAPAELAVSIRAFLRACDPAGNGA